MYSHTANRNVILVLVKLLGLISPKRLNPVG